MAKNKTLNVQKAVEAATETNVADTTKTVVTEGVEAQSGNGQSPVENDPNVVKMTNPEHEGAAQPGLEPTTNIEPVEGQNVAIEPAPEQATPPFRTLVSDNAALSEEDLAHLLPGMTVERRPDVALDNLPQPPVLTEKTMAELSLGRTTISPLVEHVSETVQEARNAVSERTRLEQEAGREAVARKQADYDRSKRISDEANARRLREGGAADSGDLGYSQPR